MLKGTSTSILKALINAREAEKCVQKKAKTNKTNSTKKTTKKSSELNKPPEYDNFFDDGIFGLTLHAKPIAKERPRFTLNKSLFESAFTRILACKSPGAMKAIILRCMIVYTNERTAKYEKLVKDHAINMMLTHKIGIIQEPVYTTITVGVRNAFDVGAPDIDNIVKSLLDGMNGQVFADDRLVRCIEATKINSDYEFAQVIFSKNRLSEKQMLEVQDRLNTSMEKFVSPS